jgi:ribosomal protein S18 acetylase RimI-like enzyme
MTVELRAPTLDDVEALTDLVNRDADELYGEPEETPESIAQWLTGPGLDPATDSRIAIVDGELRGYVDIYADPDPLYAVDLRVPPSEGTAVREALADWAEEEAASRVAGKAVTVMRFWGAALDMPKKQALETRGYRVIRHFYRMRIDFEGEIPGPSWAEGVAVRPGTAADAQAAYEVQQETFRDSWSFNPVPFDEWRHWMMSHESFDPSLWFIAEAQGEIVGLALNRIHEADDRLGWVNILGVRRPWRRRGLARALLLHTFREFQARGAIAVALGVDAESLTGANRLYESVGMKVARQTDTYEKELLPGTV